MQEGLTLDGTQSDLIAEALFELHSRHEVQYNMIVQRVVLNEYDRLGRMLPVVYSLRTFGLVLVQCFDAHTSRFENTQAVRCQIRMKGAKGNDVGSL